LLYYAASLTGNPDSGLDVLQDVWIKVFRGIRKLKDPGSVRSVDVFDHAWYRGGSHPQKTFKGTAEKVQLEDFQEAEEPSFADEDAAAIIRH